MREQLTELENMSPAKHQRMNNDQKNQASEIALLTNTQVYIMAEKYDVQALKILAKMKYEELVISYWSGSSSITTLRLLFEGTTEADPLMQVAIKTAARQGKHLVGRGEFASLFGDCGELAFKIFKASMEDNDDPRY